MQWFSRLRSRRNWQLPPGMTHFAAHGEMDADRVRRLEDMAYHQGAYFDSYLVTEPNREYLWSSDNRAVVGFFRVGRYLHVAGGIVGEESAKPRMLTELVEFARINRLTISFFHIEESDIPLFREFAFQVTKFGIESRLPLAGHTWQGKDYSWVRRQSSFVTRQGVGFEEWKHGDLDPRDWSARYAELREICDEFLAGKAQQREIPFFEGQLLPNHLYRRRVFVARANEGRGRVEGFVVCNPMCGGRRWAIEMYRQRSDAVRGTIPFMMQQTIELLKQEGCEEVSISPLPAIGCEQKLPGDNTVVRIALNLWRRLGYAFFDVNGIYHFKSRFRPEFRDIFVCAFPRSGLGATLAYMKLVGAIDLKIGALLKKIFRWTRQRRTMARLEPVVPTAADVLAEATGDASQKQAA